jgi:3-oxoacyl-[acyl-carrier protein] reductase
MNRFKDKVVLITGAGKGSGRYLARAFAECGAIVAANDISPVNVEEVVELIVANGGNARAYVEDIAKKVGAQHIVNQVEDDFGRIDILINHAAVEPHISLLDMDEWDWHRVLDVNLTGAFLMIQSVGRLMRASLASGSKDSGVIINLITPGPDSAEGEAAFVASMQGLVGLTQSAVHELSQYGIRVYAVEGHADTIVDKVFSLLDL